MDAFLTGHPYFVAFVSVMLTLVGKRIWEQWLSKAARVTPEKCGDMQKICKEAMLAEFHKFKYEVNSASAVQDGKFAAGDESFKGLTARLERTNALLKALLQVQMEVCRKTPGIDCEDITGLLIEQGIEAASLDFRKRAK